MTRVARSIDAAGAPAAIGPYSHAVRVGELLFCSGQIPLDPATGEIVGDDAAEQARRCLENLAGGLRRGRHLAGARRCALTVYMTDLARVRARSTRSTRSFFAREPPGARGGRRRAAAARRLRRDRRDRRAVGAARSLDRLDAAQRAREQLPAASLRSSASSACRTSSSIAACARSVRASAVRPGVVSCDEVAAAVVRVAQAGDVAQLLELVEQQHDVVGVHAEGVREVLLGARVVVAHVASARPGGAAACPAAPRRCAGRTASPGATAAPSSPACSRSPVPCPRVYLVIATSVIRLAAIINFSTIILESVIIHDMVLLPRNRKEPHEQHDHHRSTTQPTRSAPAAAAYAADAAPPSSRTSQSAYAPSSPTRRARAVRGARPRCGARAAAAVADRGSCAERERPHGAGRRAPGTP